MSTIAELKATIEKAQAGLTAYERKEIVERNARFIERCFEKDGAYYRVLDVNPEDGYLRLHCFGQSATGDYFTRYAGVMEAHSLTVLHEIGHREFDRAWKRFLKTLQSWK